MKKVTLLIVGLALCATAAWSGRIGYRSWKQEHLLRQARYFLSQSDPTNAVLCLQQAVQSDPSNVEACRMFAAMAELAGSRNVLFWRRRVLELEPGVFRNHIELAHTALRFQDAATAKEALGSVNPADRKTADYCKLAAGLAFLQKQYVEAETNYLEALRLEPTNSVSAFDLASVELASPDTNKQAEGRVRLDGLKTNSLVGCQALRVLVMDSARNGALDKASAYSDELVANPHSIFTDRIARLDLLARAHSPAFEPCLASLQNESLTNLAKAFELGKWMCGQNKMKETIAWVHSLAPAVRTNMPVPVIEAEATLALGDWPALASLVKGQNWKALEYLRHAYYAKALREQQQTVAASAEWRDALKDAQRRLDALDDLAHRTEGWDWGPEYDETLWRIVEDFPLNKSAFLALYDRLLAAGNTPGLQSLLAKTATVVSTDVDLKNNLAIVSLLLNPQDARAHTLAHDAYTLDPKNPFVLSTYAYSLYLQNKTADALTLFSQLDTKALTNNPSVAIYYGIILAGSGKGLEARPYLDRAEQARLLPEEKTLVKKAREKAMPG
jgi:tetratricopeptide (TPR) repeat protein